MARFRRGATPKLNEALIKNISEFIRSGETIESAAKLCEISKDTLYRWLSLTESRHSSALLNELSDSIRQARMEAKAKFHLEAKV